MQSRKHICRKTEYWLFFAAFLIMLSSMRISSRAEAFDDAMLKETQSRVLEILSEVTVFVSSPIALTEPPVIYLNEYACEAKEAVSGNSGAYTAVFYVPEGKYKANIALSYADSTVLSMTEPLFINVSGKDDEAEATLSLSYLLRDEDDSQNAFLSPEDPAGKLVINSPSAVPGTVTMILRSENGGGTYLARAGEGASKILLFPEGSYSIERIDSPKGSSFRPENRSASIRIENGRTTVLTLCNSTDPDASMTEMSEAGKASLPRNALIGIVALINFAGILLLSAGYLFSRKH